MATQHDLTLYAQIVQDLVDRGAHLLPLRGWYNRQLPPSTSDEYATWKKPAVKEWRHDPKPAPLMVANVRRGAWFGFRPESLNLAVLDADTGAFIAVCDELDALDYRYVLARSRKGAHILMRAGASWPSGNGKWAYADWSKTTAQRNKKGWLDQVLADSLAGGDIRYDDGYAVAWQPEKLVEAADLPEEGSADENLARLCGWRPPQAPLFSPGHIGRGGAVKSRGGAHSAPDSAPSIPNRPDLDKFTPERYPPGNRDDQLLKDLNALAHRRLLDDPVSVAAIRDAWLNAQQPKAGEDRAADFADKLARAREHVGKTQVGEPFQAKDARALSGALSGLGIAWAYNRRMNRVEFKRHGELMVSKADDAVEAAIRDEIEEKYTYFAVNGSVRQLKIPAPLFEDKMLALIGRNPDKVIDTFALWLERDLPEPDGKTMPDNILIDLFAAADDALVRWAGRYFFLGAIQRAYAALDNAMRHNLKLDEIPVLIGKQGWGKSAFLKTLFPLDWQRQWFTDSFDINAAVKDRAEQTQGSVMVEIGEMAGAGIFLERQKVYLTSTTDKYRAAYARKSGIHDRDFIFAGTADRLEVLPNDPAGNRRFVAIPLGKGANVEAYLEKHRLQYWANALAMYKAAPHRAANLPRELMAVQAAANEEYRYRDDVVEDMVNDFAVDADLSTAEIYARLDLPTHPNNRMKSRVAKALQHAGWSKIRTKTAGKRNMVWRHKDAPKLI